MSLLFVSNVGTGPHPQSDMITLECLKVPLFNAIRIGVRSCEDVDICKDIVSSFWRVELALDVKAARKG